MKGFVALVTAIAVLTVVLGSASSAEARYSCYIGTNTDVNVGVGVGNRMGGGEDDPQFACSESCPGLWVRASGLLVCLANTP